MDLTRLIYVSQPFGFDDAILSGILLDARKNNKRDSITGALVCRQDIYLQLLEGPETEVLAAFERISRDDRHLEIRKLVSRPVHDRIFGDWAMLHDPAKSWIWTQSELSEGALDNATPEEIEKVFENLAERVKNVSSV
ncbi:MAG: BLUF domain-containing protein [Rhodobacteraceae bacterium]|nr:BLUF domain-containing protein [Paracoccaceae bacterium]